MKFGYKRLLLFIICFCIITFCRAKINNYHFTTIGLEEGLSSNMINDVYADSKGYIWIATNNGLNRFDGKHVCKYFVENDSKNILSNRFLSIAEDGNQKIWLKNGQHNYIIYNEKNGQFDCKYKDYLQSLGIKVISDFTPYIYTDKNKDLWVIYPKAVYYYKFRSQQLRKYYLNDVSSIDVKHNKAYIVKNDLSLDYIDLKTNKITSDFSLKRRFFIKRLESSTKIFVDSKKGIWIFDENNDVLIYKRTPNSEWKNFGDDENSPRIDIHNISEDKYGNVIFAMGHSHLCYYDRESDEVKKVSHSSTNLPLGIVNRVYCSSNSIWVCSERKGISYSVFPLDCFGSAKNWANTEIYDKNVNIRSILQDHNNLLWCATHSQGVIVCELDYEKEKINVVNHISIENPGNYIEELYEDKKNRIWAGTINDGVYIYKSHDDTTPLHFRKGQNGLADDNIIAICEDNKGNVWVGGRENGIQKFNESKKAFEKPVISNKMITDIEPSKEGKIYVASEDGLYVVDVNTNKYSNIVITRQDSLSSLSYFKDLKQVRVDSRGWLWFGGINGAMLKASLNSPCIKLGVREGFINENINTIVEDGQKNMWISTEFGLIRISIPKGLKEPKLCKLHIQNFSSHDGLASDLFNQDCSEVLKSNAVLFGNIDGISIVHPEKVPMHRISNNVNISELHIGNDSICTIVDTCTRYRIPSNHSFFSIYFSCQDGDLPHDRRYAYRLAKDDDWTYTTNPELLFSHLMPGNHTIELCLGGAESTNITRLNVYVCYPWWATWWAITLYIIGGIGLCYLWRRSRLKRKLLLDNITSLQDEMKIMMERYQNEKLRMEINTHNVEVNDSDDELKQKVIEIIEKNIDNSAFTVEMLSQELGMSRASLHRKLVAITGQSPLGFIRLVRLQRAKQLLEKNHLNVAEVAYSVGFNSPKIFSKYFKDEFGVLPSQIKG